MLRRQNQNDKVTLDLMAWEIRYRMRFFAALRMTRR